MQSSCWEVGGKAKRGPQVLSHCRSHLRPPRRLQSVPQVSPKEPAALLPASHWKHYFYCYLPPKNLSFLKTASISLFAFSVLAQTFQKALLTYFLQKQCPEKMNKIQCQTCEYTMFNCHFRSVNTHHSFFLRQKATDPRYRIRLAQLE